MADSALRLISKTGREALDIENDMVRILGLVDWVRAIASEPNMHPIHRRFNLNADGSYLARRKQRERHGELLAASEDCLARLEAVANKNSLQGV